VQACAVETHVKISQEPLDTEIYKQDAADQNRAADFARACTIETHVKISGQLYTEIYRQNAEDQNCASDFVQACAIETHVKISRETLYQRKLGSNTSELRMTFT